MNDMQTFKVAGRNAHRVDGLEKVTGKAVYTGDIQLAGMGYAKILRSSVAHARLLKVDATKPLDRPFSPVSKCPDEAMARIKLEDYVPGEVLQHIPMDRTTYWA